MNWKKELLREMAIVSAFVLSMAAFLYLIVVVEGGHFKF